MRTLLDAIRPLGCSTLCLWVVSFLASPTSAAVESDVVGYTTITMEAGKWYQVGNPFVALEEGGVIELNDGFGTGFATGDQLYLYNSIFITPILVRISHPICMLRMRMAVASGITKQQENLSLT